MECTVQCVRPKEDKRIKTILAPRVMRRIVGGWWLRYAHCIHAKRAPQLICVLCTFWYSHSRVCDALNFVAEPFGIIRLKLKIKKNEKKMISFYCVQCQI